MFRLLKIFIAIPSRTIVGFLGLLFTHIGAIALIGFQLHPALRPEAEPTWGAIGLFLSPLIIILGLILVVFGMLEHRRRVACKRKTTHPVKPLDQLWIFCNSFGSRQGKSLAILFLAFFVTFGALAGTGFLRLGLFMETNKFCGLTCHTEMSPQWTAFQESPHSGIQCIKCHIGTTPQQMFMAKMRGTKELFDVLSQNVHTPIGDPVHTLPPVEQSCGKCHKPGMDYDDKIVVREHTLSDKENTKVYGIVRLKIGSDKSGVDAKGIHWHAAADTDVKYVSEDDRRKRILYVKKTDAVGRVTEYYLDDPLDDTRAMVASNDYLTRKMDCYDCHNRTGHRFDTVQEAVDKALSSGKISRKLPSIRAQGIKALSFPYESKWSATREINKKITAFYRANYEEILEDNPKLIERAIVALQSAWHRNIFNGAEVSWGTYTDYGRHGKQDGGCFRCHNQRMRTAKGKLIPQDCTLCHDVIADGEKNPAFIQVMDQSMFKHSNRPKRGVAGVSAESKIAGDK